MQKTAKGQITLVSLSDGQSSMFFISANKSTQQIYIEDGGGTYYPDYTQSGQALKLTPNLRVGKTIITNGTYTWKKNGVSVDSNNVNASGELTINTNITGYQDVYVCTASYTDPNSGAPCTTEAQAVVSKITSGRSIVTTFLEPVSVSGIVDKPLNYIDQENNKVAYGASVYYSAGKKNNEDDSSAIVYRWQIFNQKKNDFVGFTGISAIETGAIDEQNAGNYTKTVYLKRNPDESSTFEFIEGTSDNYDVKIYNDTIILTSDAIDVKETIRCEAEYYDKSGSTRGTSHGKDADIETVRDLTDPYTCGISATSSILTSSFGSTLLTARLYQNGKDVTTSVSDLKYDWDAYSVNSESGAIDQRWEEYQKKTNEGGTYYEKINVSADGVTETGQGYWVVGGNKEGDIITNPDHVQSTGASQVTVYKSQVGNMANVECVLSW